MPAPGKLWQHVIINTHCSWLHGDPRGFRARHHRLDSTGDYKSPPPPGEHAGLHEYHQARSAPKLDLPTELLETVGLTILNNLTEHDHRVLCVSVSREHCHILAELPASLPQTKQVIGWAKQKSSRAVTALLPGQVWSEGGTYKPVRTIEHQPSVFPYILRCQGPGAWTWSYRDGIRRPQRARGKRR